MIRPCTTRSPVEQRVSRAPVTGHRRRKPLARGHRWPSGSIGPPQNGQLGRPGGEHLLGPLDERARHGRRDPDQEAPRRAPAPRAVARSLLARGCTTSASATGNTSITTRSSSGSQDSVIVPARNSSSIGCSSGSVSSSADRRHRGDQRPRAASAAISSSSSSVDALGQDLHLLLLQRHAESPGARPRLQEERARPGLADGAGDEALGRVEPVDERHVTEPRRAPKGPPPPPTAASASALAPSPRFLAGGGEPGQVAGVGVGRQHEGAGRRCSGRPTRRRVDDDPLEQVEVHARARRPGSP